MSELAGLQLLAFVAEYAVGLVFLRAAIAKLLNREAFTATLEDLHTPNALRGGVFAGVIMGEASVGVALLSGAAPYAAGISATVVSAVLVAVSVYALRAREPIVCSCFGGSGRYLGFETLIISAPMLVVSIASSAIFAKGNVGVSIAASLVVGAAAVTAIAIYRWVTVLATLMRVVRHRRAIEDDQATAVAMEPVAMAQR